MNLKYLQTVALGFVMLMAIPVFGQTPEQVFKAAGTPANPKVQIAWNRYYTYDGVTEISRKLQKAYPELLKMESIGKSYENRDIWVLNVTNLKNGDHLQKPGFYIDGNIHASELQGTEISLYTAWYLLENYYDNQFIKELLDEKVFYIIPTTNPDGRENYMKKPNTVSSPRSGTVPLDDDGDGLVDEDSFDDLNNDGHITQMRRRSPNGNFRLDPEDPRMMVPVKPGEVGDWEILGQEGIDRDGDGKVNEDRTGYYDPNRDWGWNWQPDYVQRGAYLYPFSLPETRAVRDFVMSRPNIAGAQTYHNSGGMILRGPGVVEDENEYLRIDRMVYDAIGEKGEIMLPGYRYLVLYKDLYSVYGGQIDWFHFSRGIYTFTNELFTNYLLFYKETRSRDESMKSSYLFDKYLLFEDAFVPWQEFDHPQFGKIEIGGFKKNYGRLHAGFILEQDAHRNMAFTLLHAYHTPKLVIEEIQEKDLGGGLTEVTVVVANKRLIPTHSGIDLKYKIERPNSISIQNARVLAGLKVSNRDLNVSEEQKINPSVINVDNIPGMSTVTVRWIIEGKAKYSIKVDSAKGGLITRSN